MKILGCLLIAIPYIAISALFIKFLGWRVTLTIWGVTVLTAALIGAGVWLVQA